MKKCPWCHREVADFLKVCPHVDCRRPLEVSAAVPPAATPPSLATPPGVPLSSPYAAPPVPLSPPASPAPPVSSMGMPPGVSSGNPYGAPPVPPPVPPSGTEKRIEPPVRSFAGNSQKRVEPPVQSFAGNSQKRVEPAVQMRRVEPPVAPIPGVVGLFNVFSPRLQNSYLDSDTSFLPDLRGDESAEELALRKELQNLHVSARRKYRRSKKLANAISAVVALAIAVSAWFYYATVWSYAELDTRISVQRDSLDPERLILTYTGNSRGNIAISREDEQRRTILLDHISGERVRVPQHFQWRIRGLRTGDTIGLGYREQFRVAQREIAVPAVDGIVTISGQNVLEGLVLSAVDGKPLEGVEVRIPGTDVTTKSNAEGHFRLEKIPDGKQTFEIAKTGYMSELHTADISGGDSPNLRMALSPGLKEGEIRIVLTWEKEPADLDAHLEGPLPDDSRFHISFQEKGDLKSKEFVQLDCDARRGFGPETITVLGVLPGTYKYFVHDYTNQKEVDSTALSRSRAVVKVYYGGQTYTFKPEGEGKGNLWNVCEIVISEDLKATVQKLGTLEGKKIEGLGLYEKRTREDRMEWIEEYGGNSESEKAVKEALEWLARHQCGRKGKSFGSWGRYCLQRSDKRLACESRDTCCQDAMFLEGNDYPMAFTGLAILAFQAGGHFYNNSHPYSENVLNGLAWMVKNQQENGLLITPGLKKYPGSPYHEKFMYEHGIASFALAEACAVAKAMDLPVHKRFQTAMKKAIDFTVKTQHLDGGWRYKVDVQEMSDTSVTGWQVLALKSAKEAGYQIPYKTLDKIGTFFNRHTQGSETRYTTSMAGTEALTGIGMLVRQFLLNESDSEYVRVAGRRLADHAVTTWKVPDAEDREPDFYIWYKGSLAMQQLGGRQWTRWNESIREELIRLQKKEGCERGSWDPYSDPWGEYGGRIYTTALGALSLQVYYRYATEEDQTSGLRTRGRITAEEVPPETSEDTADVEESSREVAVDEDAVLKEMDAGLVEEE
ncbi:MAG: carboxypeptidase-like regulatory domain-containing protein [Planctomycetia bacterium]|nr:carboxypeptidase-like regulatory domain-containing protein [Planctomycetia bacterium]